jgi:hypothetical protein
MRYVVGLLVLLSAASAFAQPAKSDNPWAPLSFLLGEWTGEGSGQPGQGAGEFSFLPDLEKNVLVRKNRADYPATKERPAFSHTDLLIVYREPGAVKLRAIYFDSEGHVIHYAVDPSADGNAVQFLSDPSTSYPRYRLTYTKTGADKVAIQFDIAVPAKPDSFTTYIQATAHRK